MWVPGSNRDFPYHPNETFQRLKPEAQSAKPEEQKPKPEAQSAQPEEQKPKPEAQSAKPEEQKPKPEAQSSKPEEQKPKPEAQGSKPEAFPNPDPISCPSLKTTLPKAANNPRRLYVDH